MRRARRGCFKRLGETEHRRDSQFLARVGRVERQIVAAGRRAGANTPDDLVVHIKWTALLRRCMGRMQKGEDTANIFFFVPPSQRTVKYFLCRYSETPLYPPVVQELRKSGEVVSVVTQHVCSVCGSERMR